MTQVEPPNPVSAAPPPPHEGGSESVESSKILRFHRTERMLHWALAIPFLTCYATAFILVVAYNPDPTRPYRAIFSWIHRTSGVCLAIFPLLAIAGSRKDIRIHFYNIRQAWLWTISDVKWLTLLGLASVNPRINLPEQGKFNAAEKLNFMVLMGTYPLYILTGTVIWLTDVAFLSWVVHFLMALIATPLILGHIFMATINPDTRVGLQGMISGFVDRQWAKHHYARWYREEGLEDEEAEAPSGENTNQERRDEADPEL